jgi:hypothetical protein
MASLSWEEHGLTPIDVLIEIFNNGPLGLESNFARRHRRAIAALASSGAVSSIDLDGNATAQWRITRRGYYFLEALS